MVHPTSGTAGHLASAVLVVSYAFLLLFCAANLRLRGLAVVAVGIALNGIIITVNSGMPVRAPQGAVETTTKPPETKPPETTPPETTPVKKKKTNWWESK